MRKERKGNTRQEKNEEAIEETTETEATKVKQNKALRANGEEIRNERKSKIYQE